MTRILADVLAGALAKFALFDPRHESAGRSLVAALDPADREAMEIGLLLAEVERRYGPDGQVTLSRASQAHDNVWSASAWDRESDDYFAQAYGPTAHAALTALLEQLEDRP